MTKMEKRGLTQERGTVPILNASIREIPVNSVQNVDRNARLDLTQH